LQSGALSSLPAFPSGRCARPLKRGPGWGIATAATFQRPPTRRTIARAGPHARDRLAGFPADSGRAIRSGRCVDVASRLEMAPQRVENIESAPQQLRSRAPAARWAVASRHSLRRAIDLRKDTRGAGALRGARQEGATRQAAWELPVTRNASRAGAVRHLRTSSRGAHCLRQLGSKDAPCPPGAHPGSCIFEIFDLDCS